jgi:hypothetical protein
MALSFCPSIILIYDFYSRFLISVAFHIKKLRLSKQGEIAVIELSEGYAAIDIALETHQLK